MFSFLSFLNITVFSFHLFGISRLLFKQICRVLQVELEVVVNWNTIGKGWKCTHHHFKNCFVDLNGNWGKYCQSKFMRCAHCNNKLLSKAEEKLVSSTWECQFLKLQIFYLLANFLSHSWSIKNFISNIIPNLGAFSFFSQRYVCLKQRNNSIYFIKWL